MRYLFLGSVTALSIALSACNPSQPQLATPPASSAITNKTIGQIAIWDEALIDIIDTDSPIEVLAEGFQWSEGPAWDTRREQLYFSDVPQNKAFMWSETNGLKILLDPSGIPSAQSTGFREPGSNGLLMRPDGKLLIANHGRRSIELMDIDTQVHQTIVNTYQGQSLNSPNDIALSNDGTMYFTDPPYGLEGLQDSPMKELPFSGVFALSPLGDLSVIDRTQTFPNGIALSPDEQHLYVAVSDSNTPKIMRYTLGTAGKFGLGKLWFDATPYQAQGLPGLPDGMVVANSGHVFATGPGGVFILSPQGIALGQIQTGRATANCTLGDDGKSLYITAGDVLARVRVK